MASLALELYWMTVLLIFNSPASTTSGNATPTDTWAFRANSSDPPILLDQVPQNPAAQYSA